MRARHPNMLKIAIKQVEQELFGSIKEPQRQLFSRKWWYGRLMREVLKSSHFKTQMFRFVDVFPSLNRKADIPVFIKEYFGEDKATLRLLTEGVGLLPSALTSIFVTKQMKEMSRLFIIGEDTSTALPILKKMRKNKVGFTLDLLGEAVLSETEAERYQEKYLQLIKDLSEAANGWPDEVCIDQDDRGAIPKVNISIKVSALDSLIHAAAWDNSKARIKAKLRPILSAAIKAAVFINIDMEQYVYKSLVLEAFKELIEESEFRQYPHFGIVIQAYLQDAMKDLQKLVACKHLGSLTIRLVKGAYWDHELLFAEQRNWPCPVYRNKAETDQNFNSCANFILKSYPYLRLAVASHNTQSIAAAVHLAHVHRVPQKALEIQMLYGMSEAFQSALIQKDLRFREYCPMGKAVPGMAYLVRRLLENTSNESFLRQQSSVQDNSDNNSNGPRRNILRNSRSSNRCLQFKNIGVLDFAILENRKKFQNAIEEWEKCLAIEVPIIVNGETKWSDKKYQRENPSKLDQLIANISLASEEDCERAVRIAKSSLTIWSQKKLEERSQLLLHIADSLEKKRYSLAALQVLEVGKSWESADADVCEAIDFCRYYAMEIIRIASPHLTDKVLGEESYALWRARGVAVVIAPWNFPLAILTGMVSACLVTGNTLCIKPAEQSSVTAYELMKILLKCGVPKNVVHFLPGLGEVAGAYLAGHKDISLVAFTGSKEVGHCILNKALPLHGASSLKKCVVEMGGKNAIIVDDSADLDLAVEGVMESAFGFQGQKCSACSRVFVADSIHKRFTERLIWMVDSMPFGDAKKPESRIGPVIDKPAMEKIRKYIDLGKKTARMLTKEKDIQNAYFISPTIFTDVPEDSPLLWEEIFGPVLVLHTFKDLDEAVELANASEFALTGGFYSRSPSRIRYVRENFLVGNLYINRSCTGAIVKRHPFGGFKMSGLGSKAGGPDYLKQFMNPIVITENTVRRGGFSPHLV